MNTNVLLIVTLIIMAAAVVVTLKVGSTLSNKEGDSTYSVNRGRKWGRLLAIYLVVIFVVLIIFLIIMNG
jgi:ABC-type glycerol-3-phosphate transport system permease component